MWDRFFRQRAYIGTTRSRMRWYVRKNYLKWVPSGVQEFTIPGLCIQFSISMMGPDEH